METLRRANRKVVVESGLQILVIESGKNKVKIPLFEEDGSIGFNENLPGGGTRWITVDPKTGKSSLA